MREKIAFIVTGYGRNASGGTEQHCRMLAERLSPEYDVEVLTTCVNDYSRGENELPVGEEWDNGVLVRRFEADPIHPELYDYYVRKSKWSRRFRKHLYQFRLLRFLAYIHPVWTYMQKIEQKVMQSYVFYSPRLISFMQEHKNDYKAVIPINISYPLAYYVSLCIPDKTILIPTMHYESSAFRSIYTEVFTKVAYIGFNTLAEQKLAERIFGKKNMSPHGIISVGINEAIDADWDKTKQKYNLPDEYLLFVGRVDPGKLHHLVDYFLGYKKKYKKSNLKLVLVGGLFADAVQHPDIIYTGFVNEPEKYAIIQHAKVFVNPSKFESLSLILLEGMNRGKAMLVNGRCAVMKEHCIESGGAAIYYMNKRDFKSQLYELENSSELRMQMGKKGKRYVDEKYNWELIMNRLKTAIKSVNNNSLNN